MEPAAEFLELLKLGELAEHFESQGYRVELFTGRRNRAHFDLVAEKGDQKIAVEVKVRSRLKEDAQRLAELRDEARKQGIDEFRLVVVPPPHVTSVALDGLEDALRAYLAENTPEELRRLGAHSESVTVEQLDFDNVRVAPDAVQVEGEGVISVGLPSEETPGKFWGWSFPFAFDVLLDRDLKISNVNVLSVDTSSYG